MVGAAPVECLFIFAAPSPFGASVALEEGEEEEEEEEEEREEEEKKEGGEEVPNPTS